MKYFGVKNNYIFNIVMVSGLLTVQAKADTISSPFSSSNAFSQLGWAPAGQTSLVKSVGQLIAAPSNMSVSNFSFYLNGGMFFNPVNVYPDFKAYVYAWDDVNSRITGSALFSSPVMTGNTSSSYVKTTVDTSGLQLTANQKYLLFFTTLNVPQSATPNATYAIARSNPSTSQPYIYGLYSNTNNNDFTASGWSQNIQFGVGPRNLYFDLTYSSISIPSVDITTPGSIYLSTNLGTSVNRRFDGGTLKVVLAGSIAGNFTVTSNNGKIDQNGYTSYFQGNIGDDSVGLRGKLTIVNTGTAGQGSVTLSGVNTYSGGTEVQAGANLIINAASALGSGTLDLVGSATVPATLTTTSTTTISNPITVSGDPVFNVATGTTTTVASSITDGVASGDVVVSGGGTLNLTAANTYTGPTGIDAGSTLSLSGSGTIATSSGVVNNGTLDISATSSGATVNAISSGGNVVLGSKNLTVANASGDLSGVISGTGGLNITGGSQALSGVNTYTGATAISSGAALALSGSGTIATSSGVVNNGILNVLAKSSNVSLGGTYTQSSSGKLIMGFSPTLNQRVIVAGVATLGGTLNLVAGSGSYSVGRYTLLNAGGVSGTFGTFTSNLSSFTSLLSSLSYDAYNVYLNLFLNGPSVVDTQASLQNTAGALQGIYTLQNAVIANSLSYDCDTFGANNVCISAGGRNTAVSAANGLNNTSALLIAGYRLSPNYRIGAYADQNLSVNNAGNGVNLGNNTPLLGLFGAWNERLDGTGAEVKVSAAYGQKNTTITRAAVGTSEAGSGSSQLNSQGAQAAAKYGFAVADNAIVSPYVGIRYTQNNMGGYREAASNAVTAPLTYSALNTSATTVLAGIGAQYKGIPQAILFASAGVESDTNAQNGSIYATGVSGLTPVNFNSNPIKTRPTATLGATYDVEKNQRLGVTAVYRQESYQATATTTVMATYTVGL